MQRSTNSKVGCEALSLQEARFSSSHCNSNPCPVCATMQPAGVHCRWGHSTFIASSKLFIYGGADPKQRSDMFQLDLNTKAWSKSAQLGSKPDRNFSSREQSFQKAVFLSKDTLLALGRDHQVCSHCRQDSTGCACANTSSVACSRFKVDQT